MKKRYFFIALAIIALTVSGILVISKSSYAVTSNSNKISCPGKLHPFAVINEKSYLQNANNKITLPEWTYYPIEKSNLPSYRDDYTVFVFNVNYFKKIYTTSNKLIDYYINSFGSFDYFSHSDNEANKILFGYLVNVPKFSSDVEENYYYQQILIFWAMDRMMGFEDDKNYVSDYYYDNNNDKYYYTFIEDSKDNSYEDKYLIGGDYWDYQYDCEVYQYKWKYANNLSAGDKALVKNSDIGEKMLNYLETWDKYVDWYYNNLNNLKVELNNISQSDISYHVTNDYVETQLIYPNSDGKAYADQLKSYIVNASSPLVVVDKDGNERKEFSGGDGFKVRIPISEINNKNIDFSITVDADYEFPTVETYSFVSLPRRMQLPDDLRSQVYIQSQAAAIKGCSGTMILNDDLSINFSQKIGNLNIKVIDSSTGDNLSKAEVTVYDLKGNEVYKYETTDKELNISLPVGEYIVKQTVTPPNYEAQTIQMRVDVTEDGTANVVLENAPLVDVPNTAMSTGIYVIIGGLLAIAGGMIVGITFRKRKLQE